MTKSLTECLEGFDLPEFKSAWGQLRRGIEKESLRVTVEGHLAQTAHPHALGSTLTHPYITTDYSEALLEFITPTTVSIESCLSLLEDVHCFTYKHLPEGELLWCTSMPCLMENDDQIPLAQYGSSNIGKLKTLYREGLGHRYGRLMQTIAGIHYNFSMPDGFWPDYQKIKGSTVSPQQFRTDQYLNLIRNFHRNSWLLIYLFGASPAVCNCFVEGREHNLDEFDDCTLYAPYGTSLRMGNLGYKSDAQESLFICYNNLESYIDCLNQAMKTPYPPYEAIGHRNGEKYLQINTNLLQLENEFYGSIRPKRSATAAGERPLTLLRQQGIEYIEVRLTDINPFLPLGVDVEQCKFFDAFLLHCLLVQSPECNEQQYFAMEANISSVVNRGRDPQLTLHRDGQQVSLKEWAMELINQIENSAGLLDHTQNSSSHTASVLKQTARINDPELTPSAMVLKEMREKNLSFSQFAMGQSQLHQSYYLGKTLTQETNHHFERASNLSHERQKEIEAADTQDFDTFLTQWNAY